MSVYGGIYVTVRVLTFAGLKPGQRKVLFTCFKRNLVKEIKVAQLAGSVAEHSAYHHGEVSTRTLTHTHTHTQHTITAR